jgi:prevent-host-death family protein
MLAKAATEVKNHFGQILEESITERIGITKNNRRVAVLVSDADFRRLEACEDYYWAQKAIEVESEGYLGVDETAAWLERMKHAKA